ncbi:MAG TPA: POTRA domain-containing protein [Pyrinomonadaceae bacterium]
MGLLFSPEVSGAWLLHGARRFVLSCAALLLLLWSPPGASAIYAQQTPAGQMRLEKIEVSGLERVTEAQVVEASGLEIGQQVDAAALDAAAERLLGTGLFTKLGYRYRTKGVGAVVTFEVVESKAERNIPVVFDNFVWFTDDELVRAVRDELPTFDGKAPESSGAVATITRALERQLRARKIAGRVDYMPSADMAGGNAKHIFSVKGVSVPICALQFPGASAIAEKELVDNSRPLLQADYSREFVEGFAEATLKPLYWQRGHLRASFKPPGATIATAAAGAGNCKDGASVSVPVEEGAAYSWEQAVWTGNAALTAAELDAALGMKTGEVADALKINKALREVREAYGRKGYIFLSLKPRQEFADETRRVTYGFEIKEGAQFRMGALTVKGLAAADANRLKEKWALRPGDVYNASYVDEFLKKNLMSVARAGTMQQMETSAKPDRQKLTVDVTLDFK